VSLLPADRQIYFEFNQLSSRAFNSRHGLIATRQGLSTHFDVALCL